MVDYIESPLGRIVNVAWPGDDGPGILLRGTLQNIPFVFWTTATNNGVVRFSFDIATTDFAGLDIEIGDVAQCYASGALVEDAEIETIADAFSGALAVKRINCRRAYLPRASWSIPAKPDRFEIRKAGSGSLVMFSDLSYPGAYSYDYFEFIEADTRNFVHRWTDNNVPYT